VHGLRDAVAQVKAAGKTVVVATPRVIKPGEERLFTFYLRLQVWSDVTAHAPLLSSYAFASRGGGRSACQCLPSRSFPCYYCCC
jgi:hypothetical protein